MFLMPALLLCPTWPQGVPQAPMCGFSNMACAILNLYGEPPQQQHCAVAGWCWC
jgi:glutaredoxin-related protein